MIKELLAGMGLNAKESRIYMVVLERQRVTPAQVAKITKINRPTVYGIVKKLSARGLLVEDLGSKTLYVMPTPPGDLAQLVKKEEEDSRAKIKLIEELSRELLAAKSGATYPVPKIRFIEEADLEKYLYARSPVWGESIGQYDKCWWGFQDQSFVEKYLGWIDWYWHHAAKDITLRLLSNQADIEKKVGNRYARREIKPWDKSENFTATTWILGDYIVMIRTSAAPFYLVEIHDATMAHNLRETFKNLWGLVDGVSVPKV